MGTTVTTNLGLIKPDTAEKIEEALPTFAGWATQNGSNCDKIDALFRKSTHTWSPSWTADVSNPTLGSGGFTEGKYVRLHPALVVGFYRIFTGGAGFATGSGFYRLDLPTSVHADFLTMNTAVPIGKAYFHDNSAVATSSVFVAMLETTGGLMSFRKHDGNFWRDNAPVVIAQNDRLSGYFILPTVTT